MVITHSYYISSLYLALCWQDLCFSGRRALCEERCYGTLSVGGSPLGLQVTEANVDEGKVESGSAVHHLVKELHGQRDQLDHSIITATYKSNALDPSWAHTGRILQCLNLPEVIFCPMWLGMGDCRLSRLNHLLVAEYLRMVSRKVWGCLPSLCILVFKQMTKVRFSGSSIKKNNTLTGFK